MSCSECERGGGQSVAASRGSRARDRDRFPHGVSVDPDEGCFRESSEGTADGAHRERVVAAERDGQLALLGVLVHTLRYLFAHLVERKILVSIEASRGGRGSLTHFRHEPRLLEHSNVGIFCPVRVDRLGELVGALEIDFPSETLFQEARRESETCERLLSDRARTGHRSRRSPRCLRRVPTRSIEAVQPVRASRRHKLNERLYERGRDEGSALLTSTPALG